MFIYKFFYWIVIFPYSKQSRPKNLYSRGSINKNSPPREYLWKLTGKPKQWAQGLVPRASISSFNWENIKKIVYPIHPFITYHEKSFIRRDKGKIRIFYFFNDNIRKSNQSCLLPSLSHNGNYALKKVNQAKGTCSF